MDSDEAQARMQEIQRIMERATLFTLLPGIPAVVGGLLVLAGAAVSYALLQSWDFAAMLELSQASRAALCGLWVAIAVSGILLEVILTRRAAARRHLSPTDRPMRVAGFSLTPSLIVAIVLTARFLFYGQAKAEEFQYIVPIWMMLYGTGVYTAGLFSIRPPRILGLAFLCMGILALLWLPAYGVLWAALSFGLLHIAFGIYVLSHQRQVS